tara:strand:- start:1386 stop:1643 length:258 start_codon:yes stop_codon:yes gene_type:complete
MKAQLNFSLSSARVANQDLGNQDLGNQDSLVNRVEEDLVDRDRAGKAVRVADPDNQVSLGNQVVVVLALVVELLQVKCDCHQFRY